MKKNAFITGGSRGIGFGIAKCLAQEGFDIAINGVRDESQVLDVINKLKQYNVDVIYCQGNIASAEDRQRMIQKLKTDFGYLNILVNNAGVAPKQRLDILETTEESFEYVTKTNLQGPFFLTQEIANWMIEQKKENEDFEAQIINISSISATVASVNRGEYSISKAGLSMMSQLFATRLGEFDIPVYEVRPGIIETDMTAGVKEKYDKLFAQGISVQPRWGKPEDIGKVVTALAKNYLPYSTGAVIMADGGLTIPRL